MAAAAQLANFDVLSMREQQQNFILSQPYNKPEDMKMQINEKCF